MNQRIEDPPTFQFPSREGIARLLASTQRFRPFYCTHVDFTNAFLSLRLPPAMPTAFRFRAQQPTFCSRYVAFWVQKFPHFLLAHFGGFGEATINPPHMEWLHYLNDLSLVGSNPGEVQAVTDRVVVALRAASFVVSRKSMLQSVQKIFFLAKWLDLKGREIRLHPRPFPRMFDVWVTIACKSQPWNTLVPQILGFGLARSSPCGFMTVPGGGLLP